MTKPTVDPSFLRSKAAWVRKKVIELHGRSPETRIASSLSPVELLVSLFYGELLAYDAGDPMWEGRDRFIISKGHGGVGMYPILSDLGFLGPEELEGISSPGSRLASIPDCSVPGIETINGSLGLGLGMATGMALGLRGKKSTRNAVVLCGDGELYEGAVWESVMLAAHQNLDQLLLIIDHNKISMLDYCDRIVDISPLSEKFRVFGWEAVNVDGHDIESVHGTIAEQLSRRNSAPKVVIADTIKGKGVPWLEGDSLCHVKSLSPEQINELLGRSR